MLFTDCKSLWELHSWMMTWRVYQRLGAETRGSWVCPPRGGVNTGQCVSPAPQKGGRQPTSCSLRHTAVVPSEHLWGSILAEGCLCHLRKAQWDLVLGSRNEAYSDWKTSLFFLRGRNHLLEQLVQGGTVFASVWSFPIEITYLYKIKVLYFMTIWQFGQYLLS